MCASSSAPTVQGVNAEGPRLQPTFTPPKTGQFLLQWWTAPPGIEELFNYLKSNWTSADLISFGRPLMWHPHIHSWASSLFLSFSHWALKQPCFILAPPLAALRLPSTSSRQRADAGKHFLSPRSYFLPLGIHFLSAANTTALRAFLRSLPYRTHIHPRSENTHVRALFFYELVRCSCACRQTWSLFHFSAFAQSVV